MKAGAIIVAGGQGLRAGGSRPKQLQLLCGNAVFKWSLDILAAHPLITQLVLVVPTAEEHLYKIGELTDVTVVTGGSTRTQSVRNGLAALALEDTAPVLIHDAARPGLTLSKVSELLGALEQADAVAPALRVVDALKKWGDGPLISVDRSDLYRVQTPQAFRFARIRAALAQSAQDLVDDLAAIEADGGKVALIEGSERLAKITYPGDLERMARLMGLEPNIPRVGNGYDVHAFEVGDAVILCGVSIPHSQKLAGHSDADVAWHTLTDAILGACALGDIGDHFPPSDPQWKGAPSELFLKHAVKLAKDAGYQVTSCDITIVCEAPKVKPHREAMRAKTADVIGLPISAVSVKATTTEGLGFTGRREGIAAHATAVLSPLPDPA